MQISGCPETINKNETFNFTLEFFGFNDNVTISINNVNSFQVLNENGTYILNSKILSKSFDFAGYYYIYGKDNSNNYNSSCSVVVQDLTLNCFPIEMNLDETTLCNISVVSIKELFNFTIYYNDSNAIEWFNTSNKSFSINRTYSNFGSYLISVFEEDMGFEVNQTIKVQGSK